MFWYFLAIKKCLHISSVKLKICCNCKSFDVTCLWCTQFVGVCNANSSNVYYLDGKRQFSVYSYDFNVCENIYGATTYADRMGCYATIISYWRPNLKVELIVNSESGYDFVELSNSNFNQKFSGDEYRRYEMVLPGNTLDLQWITDASATRSLGFCLTISGTFDTPTSVSSDVLLNKWKLIQVKITKQAKAQ